jgi:hypothetical protein
MFGDLLQLGPDFFLRLVVLSGDFHVNR